jgi:hypothetical protein
MHTVAQKPEAEIASCVMSPLKTENQAISNLHCILIVGFAVRGSSLVSSFMALDFPLANKH